MPLNFSTERLKTERPGTLAIAIIIYLGIQTLSRLILMLAHLSQVTDSVLYYLPAFFVGMLFDGLIALYVTTPLVLFLLVCPDRWLRARPGRVVLYAGYTVFTYAIAYLAITEYFFFGEFDSRLNYVAVDYLFYPHEVFINIWETYPVVQALIAVGVLTALIMYFVLPLIRRSLEAPCSIIRRAKYVLVYVVIISGGTFLLTIDSSRICDNRVLNEIAGNGIYSLFHAAMTNELDYNLYYARMDEAQAFTRLKRLIASSDTEYVYPDSLESIERRVVSKEPERRLNVIIVLGESFGSEFSGILHPEGPKATPYFDSLADRGMLFTHVYATGNRTVRGMEAALAGFPPIPGRSIVKRPGGEHTFTIAEVLRRQGYHTAFVYGGHAYFDNIEAFASGSGYERVIDENDLTIKTFSTIWGVCDEDLFNNVLLISDSLHSENKPFFLTVLTVSNHSPYTYPEGRIPYDPKEQTRLNAVHYADFAIGRFIRDAREHAFFDSTLFVFLGDHGARVYGAQQIPMDSYEIPILFYAPSFIEPGRRMNMLASQMDLSPTILDVLHLTYESKFFGRSVFRVPDNRRWVLMSHNRDVALLRNDTLAVLGIRGDSTLWLRNPTDRSFMRLPNDADQSLIDDAIAYYQSAYELYKSGGLEPDSGRESSFR